MAVLYLNGMVVLVGMVASNGCAVWLYWLEWWHLMAVLYGCIGWNGGI